MTVSLQGLRHAAMAGLRRHGPMAALRDRYLALVRRHAISHAVNLENWNDWVGYVYYCRVVAGLVPDREALIVDWGGLYGHVTAMLQAMGYAHAHNYLLDEAAAYADFRIALGLPTLHGTDPNVLALSDGGADVVISSGVLEHVGEDGPGDEAAVLRDIRRVLKPGGWFVIWNLPSNRSLTEWLARAAGKYHHARTYDRVRIGRTLRAAGFTVVAAEKHTLLPGAFWRRMEWAGGPVNRFAFDDALSRLPLLRAFARDWLVLAQRA